jgi:hypothetical protein
MKPALLLTAALTVVTATTAFPANAGDPCGAVLCMSHNDTAPHECKDYVDEYFDIRVYRRKHGRKVFDPGATSMKRYAEVMEKCEGARQEDKDRINAKYGKLEHSPFEFYVVP